MKKLTAEIKSKHISTQKGKVFLYLIEANRIAFENKYQNFPIDTGVKDIEVVINSKIDYVFDEREKTKGAYWDEQYLGYEKIYEAAKKASDDIVNNNYSVNIIEFIMAAITIHLPKINEGRLNGQYSVIPRKIDENEKITYLAPGITGEKKKKIKEKEEQQEAERIEENIKEEKEIIELTGGLGLGAAAESLLDDDNDEQEEEEAENDSSDLSKNAEDLL